MPLLFLRDVLERCSDRPAPAGDRGPWYAYPVKYPDCEYERETWGSRSLIKAWFGLFKYRTRHF